MVDFDHECTQEIVCPYCGYTHSDSWEWDDDGEDICDNCGKMFEYCREHDITYSTNKKETQS